MRLTKKEQQVLEFLQDLCNVCIETHNNQCTDKLQPITVKFSSGRCARAHISKNIITYPINWLRKYDVATCGFLVIIAHEVSHFIVPYSNHSDIFKSAETLLLYEFEIRPIYYKNYRYPIVYCDLNGQILCDGFGQNIKNNIASKQLLLF